jgi:hypothetical protein
MSWRRHGITVLAGITMAVVVDLIDRGLAAIGLHAETTRIDDLLVGLAAALIVWLLQRQQERELQRQRHSATVIEQMNHHIRNALQIIVTRASLDRHARPELRQIDAAVARIDWALREILPQSASNAPVPDLAFEPDPEHHEPVAPVH